MTWPPVTANELRRLYPNCSEAFVRANADPGSVAPAPLAQPSVGHDPVAENAGGYPYTGRCLISITSFRLRLCDERNLTDKYFTDALIEAGLAPSDSPQFVKVEVGQV